MKKVLLLTPIYPGPDIPYDTPVVHFFAREWAKLGYDVHVIHYIVNFPKLIHFLARPFHDYLESKYASVVRTKQVEEKDYIEEGVSVKRIPLLKYRPHSRYSSTQIDSAFRRTIDYCNSIDFKPDVIISHWINPQYEIMVKLKEFYNVPMCFICHDNGDDFYTIYKKEADKYIGNTDVIGYRSDSIKREFERHFNVKCPTFMCYSGIPFQFLDETVSCNKEFNNIESFVFVGTLIKRKFPSVIVPALKLAFGNDAFRLSYIGEGIEEKEIRKAAKKLNDNQNVKLYGKQNRDFVAKELQNNDVFVMISKGETFGLVYLEAMAKGCITIASRNEGFDGIIKNGINGFLCEAGNVIELSQIIKQIREMPASKLKEISNEAKRTARELTDRNVAKHYIEKVFEACRK